MRLYQPVLLVLSACVLMGCPTVVCTSPMGETPVSVTPADWDGTWHHAQGAVSLEVTNARKGVLKATSITKGNTQTDTVYLRHSGDWMFASVPESEDEKRYHWLRVKKDGNRMIAWEPKIEKVRALVKEGNLPGSVDEDGNVTLGELQDEHLDIITESREGVVLNWENPITLVRVSV